MYVVASDDLPGLHLVSHSRADVVADIPDAIAFLYKMNAGIDVQVQAGELRLNPSGTRAHP